MVGVSELDHEWNMVQLDGYWYGVDVTASDKPEISMHMALRKRDEANNNLLASQGYFSTHPYGTKYFAGCKVFIYNSADELKADCLDKSSKLWKEFNENGSVGVNVLGKISDYPYQLLPR
ncbi:MAG: hypothetical protein ACLR6B_03240 [Blautia sp.]